jgi:hypothetical protein
MRYTDFKTVILEYKREPTARSFGEKIIARIGASPLYDLPGDLGTIKTLIDVVMSPDRYQNWGIGQKRMQFGGSYISFGLENASEVLQQLKPRIIDSVLQELEQSDPTPNKVFVPWLAREWSNGNIRRLEDIDSRLRPLLQDFIAYKNRRDFPPEAKDIMRLAADKFEAVMTAYQPPPDQARARGKSKTLLDNEIARVIVPQDEEAACYYGQGTRWCTAATRGNNMFNHYNSTGTVFIILPKHPKHEGEKYQLHFYSEQFMDESDDPVDLQWLLVERFPELLEPFKKLEPQIADYVSFTDDATLMALWKLIGEAVQDAVWDNISDWEASDDYYHRWRSEEAEKRGYMTVDGEVDWDKVHEDDDLNSYTDFNDHAGQYERDFMAVQDADAKQIKAFAHEVWENGDTDGTPSLSDLEELFAGMLETESRQEMESLTQFLQSKVFIRKNFKKGPDGKIKNGSIIGDVGLWTVGVNWGRR